MHQDELDKIYICLETIRTTASPELVAAVHNPDAPLQKPYQQERSKRRRASNADNTTMDPVKRLKLSLDPSSIINDLKNRELSNIDFHIKAHQLLQILERENNRRQQFPDSSYAQAVQEPGNYERAIQGTLECKVDRYLSNRTRSMHTFTD